MDANRRKQLFDEKLKQAYRIPTEDLFDKYGFSNDEREAIGRGYRHRTGKQGANGRTSLYKAVLKVFDAHFSTEGRRYDTSPRRKLIVAGMEFARRKNLTRLTQEVREGHLGVIVAEARKHIPSIEQVVTQTRSAYDAYMRANSQWALLNNYVRRGY